jgi:hypothetical protein
MKLRPAKWGSMVYFAQQQFRAAHVAFGSKARITAPQHCCPVSPQTTDMPGSFARTGEAL